MGSSCKSACRSDRGSAVLYPLIARFTDRSAANVRGESQIDLNELQRMARGTTRTVEPWGEAAFRMKTAAFEARQ